MTEVVSPKLEALATLIVDQLEDRWEGGIQVYANWMKERVIEMRRVLKPTGSLYLHCDWHAAHRLRQTLDGVFGDNRSQNEIVWCSLGVVACGGRSSSGVGGG